jgi:hypothetical protein
MNKLNYDYSLKKMQERKQKNKKQSPPVLKQWIVESKHILQQKKAALLSKPNNKNLHDKKLNNNNNKKKKVVKRKKNINTKDIDSNNDSNLPIDVVLKFSESLEIASRNLVKLTTKLKSTIDVSGILLSNNSYTKSNNTSISTPTKKPSNGGESNANVYGQKFNDEEEEELDYLVKTRLKKRLLEIIGGQNFSNTI